MATSSDALGQILDLALTLNADMSRSFERSGLTAARAHLLWVLRAQGPSTQKALATTLDVSPRNVTGLVDGLEASGLVARRAHPTDRRATLVTLTPPGEELVEVMAREERMLAEGLFGDMDTAELERFTSVLGRVTERLKRMVAEDAARRAGAEAG